ncbi:MAG: hypothetical protein J7500_00515 [Sphingomonas sp.]|uniref:hypothetical protein n=1 Tax=Sphingomonas sp. TaxID=28214 RepID=UPI001B068F90|nr:hypothetical protein [Sphingomonas sp.]MBO9621170.1 hypothetical protein [Sphingomonas sp.]
MPLRQLYDQHLEIYRLGDQLLESVATDTPDITVVLGARRTLSQATARHIAHEARLALAPLSASSDPLDRALASRYTSAILAMRQKTSAVVAHWTPKVIGADPAGYRRVLEVQLKALAEQGAWEEAEFLPAAARLHAVAPLRKAG